MELNSYSSTNPTLSRKICIIGTGMVTAIGYHAPMTAASVRANISRFHESYMIDKAGEPMLLSMAEFVDDDLRGLERLLALAVPAANEAMTPLKQNGYLQKADSPIPICLGIAAPRPGFDERIESQIIFRLESDSGFSFSKTERFVISAGHASGLMAVNKGVQLIESGQYDFVLTGGVDSYYDPDTLEWLDENKRLHSEQNKDGFVPGEGAGFCLLASFDFIERYKIQPLAIILSCAYTEETNPFISNGISIGQGLTQTLQKTLKVLEGTELKADWVICDMNGESFRGMEWAYAYLRTGPKHADPLEIWHPADCFGDIGAASGLVLTGLGIAAWQRNYARGNRSLVWTSSDDKQRSAILIQNSPNNW